MTPRSLLSEITIIRLQAELDTCVARACALEEGGRLSAARAQFRAALAFEARLQRLQALQRSNP